MYFSRTQPLTSGKCTSEQLRTGKGCLGIWLVGILAHNFTGLASYSRGQRERFGFMPAGYGGLLGQRSSLSLSRLRWNVF